MIRIGSRVAAVVAVSFALVMSGALQAQAPKKAASAAKSSGPQISQERLLKDIKTLSSDEFEGRGPGSKGEEITVQYLQGQFKSIGLEPGNPDGTYVQKVPMVGITPEPGMQMTISGITPAPQFQKDYVAFTKRVVDTVSMDGGMVFV